MPRMPRKTVARRSLKAKDAATAATVAASAQTPALRTSGTEEHTLSLPASHLGASDYMTVINDVHHEQNNDNDTYTTAQYKTEGPARGPSI